VKCGKLQLCKATKVVLSSSTNAIEIRTKVMLSHNIEQVNSFNGTLHSSPKAQQLEHP
jgi:hypothetical protein